MSTNTSGPTRDEKATNLVMNYSMVLMFAFEDAFASIASTMSEALVKGSTVMAEAIGEGLGGTPHEDESEAHAEELAKQAKAQTSKKVKETFAEMRKKARSEIRLDDESLKELIRTPAFDEGIAIVERHEFGLPRLTERLSDEDFASYIALMKRSDPGFVKMSEELSEWRKSVPDPKQGH